MNTVTLDTVQDACHLELDRTGNAILAFTCIGCHATVWLPSPPPALVSVAVWSAELYLKKLFRQRSPNGHESQKLTRWSCVVVCASGKMFPVPAFQTPYLPRSLLQDVRVRKVALCKEPP